EPVPSSFNGRFHCGDGTAKNWATILAGSVPLHWPVPLRNHVKESKLALLFGKLKYEENLIDSIYGNEYKKDLTIVTPLSTAFISTFIVQDFQDSHDDEKNTKSSQKYLNDLEEDFQARALLAKSKKFFKKGSQRFNSAKATKDTQYHKCGRNGHFVRDCFSKTLVHSFPSPSQNNTQPRLTCSSHHKTESKDFEVKYNKVKAKLALLSPGASASSSTLVKNKGLVTETCKWDEEDVSSDDNEVIEVKDLMALTEEETVSVSKEFESQRNSTDHPVTVIDSSETESDSTDESSVWSTSFPPLEKPGDAEPVSRSKTVKTTFKSICTFKTKALKGIIPNEPSSYLAQENKKASALKSNPAPAKNSKNVKITDNLYLATKERSIQEILSILSKDVKSVAVPSIPQLITMTLNGSKESIASLPKSVDPNPVYHTPLDDPLIIRDAIFNERPSPKCNTKKGETIFHDPYQMELSEMKQGFRKWETILSENVISLMGNKDHPNDCLVYMLFCLVNRKPFNLAYYIVKRMASVVKHDISSLPYGMLLTRLYRHVQTIQPCPVTDAHFLTDHVMVPLTEGREKKLSIVTNFHPFKEEHQRSSSKPRACSSVSANFLSILRKKKKT
nr:hypothetical protein [Tanacetum cinerariifolium]